MLLLRISVLYERCLSVKSGNFVLYLMLRVVTMGCDRINFAEVLCTVYFCFKL